MRIGKILIVVDMQNDFVTGSLGTPEAQAIVPRVVEKVRECEENGYNIFFTQDTHYRDEIDPKMYPNYLETLEGKYLPVEHCIYGTPGRELIPELEDQAYFKIYKNTFGCGNWDRLLSEYEVEQFELIGLCTDICVISNALILRAQFHNSEIIVHADCCAGTTPEKHAAALEVMKSCQIQIKGE